MPLISRRQKGFTLLEVIVALAIMGLCTTVILRIFASVSGATGINANYYQALEIAETQMSLLLASEEAGRRTSGSVDDFRWQSSVTEYRPNLNDPLFSNSPLVDANNNIVPYHYQISVSWGTWKKREIELNTVRLGVRE